MDLPMIDNTSAYIDVCNKAGLPINKMPKKGDDIPLAYEMAMKEFNPYLYQNLVQPDPTELPADVLDRHNRQAYCCLLYTSPSPRDKTVSRMPSSA